nr:virulence RhuM family protein [Chitinophagaceae bacterium]
MIDIENKGLFLFYNGSDGKIKAQVIIGVETVWVSQKGMAEIFGVDRTVITKHLRNIFDENELDEDSVCAKIAHTADDGKKYQTLFYNLDAIIAVGYRANSYKATQFRIWSNKITKEYLIKGFALDDERLKQGNRLFGKDYFKELLERVREIRASERMFYEKITDLYATSIDYDKNNPETHRFFAKVQNKLEFAIVGKTSAEIVKSRADSSMPNMGLKTWKNAGRNGKVQKSDVTIAKNYLNQDELRKLNTLVNMYLDYAELQIERNRLMTMDDWSNRLDAFLKFNEYEDLDGAGKMRKDIADNYAESEYIKYRVIQDIE